MTTDAILKDLREPLFIRCGFRLYFQDSMGWVLRGDGKYPAYFTKMIPGEPEMTLKEMLTMLHESISKKNMFPGV